MEFEFLRLQLTSTSRVKVLQRFKWRNHVAGPLSCVFLLCFYAMFRVRILLRSGDNSSCSNAWIRKRNPVFTIGFSGRKWLESEWDLSRSLWYHTYSGIFMRSIRLFLVRYSVKSCRHLYNSLKCSETASVHLALFSVGHLKTLSFYMCFNWAPQIMPFSRVEKSEQLYPEPHIS